jgi:ABC-type transport system involved in multi-copper enzyme maturation permease subunit
MLDAISAETLKLTRHKATWFLVWLYPIGFTLIFLIATVATIVTAPPPEPQSLAQWLENSSVIWLVPGHTMGRYLIAAYVALVFAGEYGWNTWKLIVPHRPRASLIGAKYAVAFGLLLIAYTLTALISILGSWFVDVVAGDPLPAGITAGGLLAIHAKTALASLAPALVTIAYASLAAVLTRSTLAAFVIALAATTVEQVFFSFGPMLSLKAPALTWALYNVLPGYHLANLGSWISEGKALVAFFPRGGALELSWATSLAAAAAWIGGLAGLTFLSFRRQDLN